MDTNLRIAELLERKEKFDEALFYYEEAYRLDPSRDEGALGLARLLRITEPDRATELIDQVLERNPSSALAHVLRSDVLLVRGDLPGALASALTAAELDPKGARVALQVAIVRKAELADRRGKKLPDDPKLFEQTDAAFARAIELAKNDPYWMVRAAIERARLLVKWRGFGPDQIEIYKSTFAALEEYPELKYRIAEASAEHARAAQDQEFLLWALSRQVEIVAHNHETWVELANLTTRLGEDGDAVLERMVKELPDDPQAQITYADQLSGKGKHAEAVAHLEKVLPTSKAPAATLAALVQLHLAAGDVSAAHGPLARLRSEYSDTGAADQAEASLANAEGRIADAIVALERWTGREETASNFGLLADARLRAGDPRGALEAVDRGLALKEQPRPDLQRLRGRILVRLGEHRSALQAFSRARTTGGPLPTQYLPDLAAAFYGTGQTGRSAQGARACDRGGRAVPRRAPALRARGGHSRSEGRARGAREGQQLYPGALQFIAGLANADLREHKPEAALERVRAAAAAAPDSPPLQMLLVQMLVTRELHDEAVQQTQLLQERWPGQPGVTELYLSVMTHAGRGEEAFQALSKKQAAGQLSPYGRVLLARLYSTRGEDAKAHRAAALLARGSAGPPGRGERSRLRARATRRGSPGSDGARAGSARQPAGLVGDRRHAGLRLHAPEPGRGCAGPVRRGAGALPAGEHGVGYGAVPSRSGIARARAPGRSGDGSRAGARLGRGFRRGEGCASHAGGAGQRRALGGR